MSQHERVEVRVYACASTARECHATARSLDDLRQPAPVRSDRLRRVEMTGSNDEREFLKGTRVNCELARQAVERIADTLNFIAVQVTVENGQINATLGMGKPKFVNHQDIMPSIMVSKMTRPQRGSNRALAICSEGSHRR
ncbi:hypothetical protein [uncultured Albimonas sp.]|uniref:hypothetical protein n=1 Tax=uncultured Albimonas sp. TaxID=1331701 RepID=UPI0030EF9914